LAQHFSKCRLHVVAMARRDHNRLKRSGLPVLPGGPPKIVKIPAELRHS
jgi:hypothetical protein